MQPKRTTLTALLILLATLSFAAATVTLTNITEWHVQTPGTPPVVKVVGNDAVYGNDLGGKLANVTIKAATDGTNRTIITIRGYTGDPTKYDEVIKICNKDPSKTFYVKLVYMKVLSGGWTYVKYLKLWLGSGGPSLNIDSTTSEGTSSGSVSLEPNSCVSVPAEVLIDANTPSSQWNTDLITIEVDVVSAG